MHIHKLKAQWKELVANDNLNELFKELNNRLKSETTSFNDFILIYNQYSNLKRQLALGILSNSDLFLKNQINDRILKFISELQETEINEHHSSSSLFGTEWELEDYYRWLKKNLNFYVVAFVLENKDTESTGNQFLSIIRIINVQIASTYYNNDTLLINSIEYRFEFNTPLIDYNKKLYSNNKPNLKETSVDIRIPLDIISDIKFIDNADDDVYKTLSPKSTYLLRIYTKGKHINYDGILTDVAALVFLDRELCIIVLNVLQYIINYRKSHPFDENLGEPILPNN